MEKIIDFKFSHLKYGPVYLLQIFSRRNSEPGGAFG